MRKLKNEELNRLDVEAFKKAEKAPIVIVLDNIRSMQNVGSAFRTSDAFRISEIILTGITARPPHREINKSALGATESVDWKHFEKNEEAIRYLKDQGYDLFCLEQTDRSVSLSDFRPDKNSRCALVFGNEVFGVSEEFIENSDQCIEIPQYGTKHSLNISVSIGIAIWSFFEKLNPNLD